MSSTPKNTQSQSTSLGWTQSLFGYLSGKKTSRVDSSTDSTKQALQAPSPKPFQNLQGFNTVDSPQQVDSIAFTKTNEVTGIKAPASSLPTQKLQATTQTSVPSKSPWKASLIDAEKVPRFSVGILKPQSSRVGTGRSNLGTFNVSDSVTVRPVNVDRPRRRNKYRTNGIFNVQRGNRGEKRNFDKAEINKHLWNARSAIDAPKEKIEFDKNFRTAFDKRIIKRGTRLYPSNRARTNGRFSSQEQPDDQNTKFVVNGKRQSESEENQKAVSARKKRRVEEKNSNHTPIENLVPIMKDTESRPAKRKPIPYKEATPLEKSGGDSKGEGEKMASLSNRKYLKIARSPSSKLKKPDTSRTERPDVFADMPSMTVVAHSNFKSWSKPDQREGSIPIKSTRILPKNYCDNDLLFGEVISNHMSKGLPQFQQKPLFKGPKKDRTVGAYDDDDEDSVVQELKKSRAEQWKCDKCDLFNPDDETYCMHFIKDSEGKSKKCGESRSSERILGWGNMFDKYEKGKIRCEKCRTLNDPSNKKCISCEAPLASANDSSQKNSSTAVAKEPKGSGGSIGNQGFSFGGGATAAKLSSTGFSFGSSAVTDTAAAPGPSSTGNAGTTTGFKFGAPATSPSSSTNSGAGFQFGAPAKVKSPSATTSSKSSGGSLSGGFQFGNPEKSKSPSSGTKDSLKVSGSSSGFQFGVPATKESSATTKSGSATAASLFQFGAPDKSKSPSATTTAALKSSASKPFSFGTAPAPSPKLVEKAAPPKPSAEINSGATLFGNFATSSTPGATLTQTPTFSFGTNKDVIPTSQQVSVSSTRKQDAEKASTTEAPDPKRKRAGADNKSGFSFSTSTAIDKNAEQGVPAISFGGSSADASKSAKASTQGFSFGGSSAKTSSDTIDSAASSKFTIAKDARTSIGGSSGTMPALGSVATGGSDNSISKKKRRSRNDLNSESSSQQNMSFGTKASNEAQITAAPSIAQAGTPAPFVFGKAPTASSKEDVSSMSAPGFGNPSNNSLSASGTPGPAPSFGSAPAPAASITFGSTPAPAPSTALNPSAPSFTFGSTPAPAPTPAAPSFTFGSTPAPTPAPNPSAPPFAFGSTPAPAPAAPATTPAAPFTFGSAAAPVPNPPTFGSTAPAPAAFGSTPAPGPSSGFGSTPSAPFGASAPMQFGSSTTAAAPVPFGAAPAAPTQPFGNTFNNTTTTFGSTQPTPGAATMSFGGTAPPMQNPTPAAFGSSGFGQQPIQQPPSAPPNAGFSLGSGGGGGSRGRVPGQRRRIIKARRPR